MEVNSARKPNWIVTNKPTYHQIVKSKPVVMPLRLLIKILRLKPDRVFQLGLAGGLADRDLRFARCHELTQYFSILGQINHLFMHEDTSFLLTTNADEFHKGIHHANQN